MAKFRRTMLRGGAVLERRERGWYASQTNGVCTGLPFGPFRTERAVRAFCRRSGWVICEGWKDEEPAALRAFSLKFEAEIAGDARIRRAQ